MPSIAALKHAPWSLSKVKCALRCPLEFEYKYIRRVPAPEIEPDLRIGKAIHATLEKVLLRAPLPEAVAVGRKELLHEAEHERFDVLLPAVEKFKQRIDDFRLRRRVKTELVEFALAVNTELEPTGFNAPDAFFRGVWDAGFVYDDGRLAVVDHKTGVRQIIDFYTDQLEGYATLAAAHLTQVRQIWLGVHFVADADMEWTQPVELSVVHGEVGPRVLALIDEAAEAVKDGFEARPSWWCTRCNYRSICPSAREGVADRAEPG